MSQIKLAFFSLALLMAAPSFAHPHYHGRVGFGVYVGPGYYYPPPYYYPPSVYYPQTPLIIQQQPPVYIEKNPPSQAEVNATQTSSDWYYCASSKMYYPYTTACPEAWQRVSPVPPPNPRP